MSNSLHNAVQQGNPLLFKSLFEENPRLVNAKDDDSRTPLIWAMSTGQDEIASIILKAAKQGAIKDFEIDEQDNAGWSALHVASSKGDLEMVRQLIENGADVNLKTNNGVTPVHLAVSHDDADVVKYLIDHNGSVRTKDNLDRTALQRAAAAGFEDIVSVLIAAKAPVSATDSYGWTALHHACAEGHAEIAVQLIKAGASLDDVDKEDHTPFDVGTEPVKKSLKGYKH
jgi:26S proteasome non-ATPase regulatory subunit 10